MDRVDNNSKNHVHGIYTTNYTPMFSKPIYCQNMTTKLHHIQKYIITLIGLLATIGVHAQDKIITTDDRIINAFNIEIGKTGVFYTVTDDVNSDAKRIDLSNVSIIKKADGSIINLSETERNDIKSSQFSAMEAQDNAKIELSDATKALNEQIIRDLNKKYEFLANAPINTKKKTNAFIRQYGISENSIIETDELYMSSVINQWFFKVWLTNKTDKIIYVDLGNTFYSVFSEPKCVYVPTATNVSTSSFGGASVNMGGIAGTLGIGGAIGNMASGVTVGGGNSKSVSEVTFSQRVVAIPPSSTKEILNVGTFPGERIQVIRQWSFKGDSKYGVTFKGKKVSEGTVEEVNNKKGSKEFSIYLKYGFNENFEGSSGTMNAEFFPIRNLYCHDSYEFDDLIGSNPNERFWIRYWAKIVDK